MKRILLLTTVFMMMLGTSFSSAQTDADNFYKTSNPQLSSSASFLRLNVLSSLN